MEFDGQQIMWKARRFRATSGAHLYQLPSYQCDRSSGPLPEGRYTVFLNDAGIAKRASTADCGLIPVRGTQKIPEGIPECEQAFSNWGKNRVRLEAADPATKKKCNPARDNFYLHDSAVGQTTGCIEVADNLISHLKQFSTTSGVKTLLLRVKYVPGRITQSDTWK